MNIIETKEQFDNLIINSSLPVMVDFFADWCGPCRALNPIIEEISKTLRGKINICKLNIDILPEIAGKYGVMSIPTLLLIEKGEEVGRHVGSMTLNGMLDWISEELGIDGDNHA